MNFSIYPIERVVDLLPGAAWRIYPVFLYCMIIGWRSLHSRVISCYRLYTVPLLISVWSLHGIFLRYSLSAVHVSIWIIAGLTGIFAGWWIYRDVHVKADKRKKTHQTARNAELPDFHPADLFLPLLFRLLPDCRSSQSDKPLFHLSRSHYIGPHCRFHYWPGGLLFKRLSKISPHEPAQIIFWVLPNFCCDSFLSAETI